METDTGADRRTDTDEGTDTEVVVVGAGVAGLTTAARLGEAGVDVTLFERRDRVGGRVRSRKREGFTLDRGFQVLLTGYPAVERELDLDRLDLRSFKPGATICRDGSRSVLADPFRNPRRAIESLFNPEVTFSDKLRTLALRSDLSKRPEFFVGPDTTIEQYLRDWGFADSYLEHFVEPFYGGITLDRSLSTSKHVFEYTFHAMSNGSIAVPAAGMGAIPEQLAERAHEAGATIETGRVVESIDGGKGGFVRRGSDRATVTLDDGATTTAELVVVATTPPEARRLTGVESIPTEGVGCVTQWYALPSGTALEDVTGKRLLLNAENGRPNTVVPISAIAPEYADDDRTLLNATFLGTGAQDRSADTLCDRTRETLAGWFPERAFGGLELLATDRIPFAQFAQPPGIHDSLPGVDAPGGRVLLAGEYTTWSSIQGALESGKRAANTVRARLAID